ncbi:MAG: SusD-like protein [Gemmatimonadetes bacterium]|nr:SusD-like protein [Gemmatimonadota bacterium]
MNHHGWKGRALGAALIAGTLGACDFIKSVDAKNPNAVPQATIDQLFTAAQVNSFFVSEDNSQRVASIWTQQTSGTDRQFSSYDVYQLNNEDLVDGEFGSVYVGGGLVDLRNAETQAETANRKVYAGILKVYEAYLVGHAASLWGDVPYSEAVDPANRTPHLDKQEAVYAALQTLLDGAITELKSGTGAGPADVDMVYGGDAAKWVRVAYTLKARYYMHWQKAEAAGGASATAAGVACGGADCVGKAIAAAALGINSSADDWQSVHSAASTESNAWSQFLSDRSGYVSAGFFAVDTLQKRGDPRLGIYYKKSGGVYVGSKPGENRANPSVPNISATTRQQIATCAETQFIIAEGQYRKGAIPAAQAALTAGVNCDNAKYGVVIPVNAGATGAALLQEIMLQKYLSEFLSSEAYNDYKRTCLPALSTAGSVNPTNIPRRFFYGAGERKNNPNVPAPGTAPNGARNTNDPAVGGC